MHLVRCHGVAVDRLVRFCWLQGWGLNRGGDWCRSEEAPRIALLQLTLMSAASLCVPIRRPQRGQRLEYPHVHRGVEAICKRLCG